MIWTKSQCGGEWFRMIGSVSRKPWNRFKIRKNTNLGIREISHLYRSPRFTFLMGNPSNSTSVRVAIWYSEKGWIQVSIWKQLGSQQYTTPKRLGHFRGILLQDKNLRIKSRYHRCIWFAWFLFCAVIWIMVVRCRGKELPCRKFEKCLIWVIMPKRSGSHHDAL